MARLTQGILGGISGKIGNVVGSSWKGIPVIKTKPLSVSNPRTTSQTTQRTKLTNVVNFSKEILTTIIKPLWDRFAQQASGYNDFVRANIALFDAAMPSPVTDLVISTGKMQATPITSTNWNITDDILTLSWDDTPQGPYQSKSDIPYLIIVNEVKEKVKGFQPNAIREDGVANINTTLELDQNEEYTLLLAFKRADGTVVSNTSSAIGTAMT